jgi:Ca2+-binding EF-hand superfamily protein
VEGEEGESGDGSLVDQAMEVIRRTAANASAYKLDLQKVFQEFDTSGDGFLSCQEMVCKLPIITLTITLNLNLNLNP